jgi:hypothetical protein
MMGRNPIRRGSALCLKEAQRAPGPKSHASIKSATVSTKQGWRIIALLPISQQNLG